jgi:hypothetical protein
MFLPHLVRKTLDRTEGAYGLYLEERVSVFVLVVNLRGHARDLAPFDEELGQALDGFASEVEAAADRKAVCAFEPRLRAWLAKARAQVDVRERGVSEAPPARRAPRAASAIDVPPVQSGPSEEEIRKAALAEVEALGLGGEDMDEVAGMTSDDIDRLLSGAKD